MPKNHRRCPANRIGEMKVGPRGGQYYATSSGKKSYCNPNAPVKRKVRRRKQNMTSEIRPKKRPVRRLVRRVSNDPRENFDDNVDVLVTDLEREEQEEALRANPPLADQQDQEYDGLDNNNDLNDLNDRYVLIREFDRLAKKPPNITMERPEDTDFDVRWSNLLVSVSERLGSRGTQEDRFVFGSVDSKNSSAPNILAVFDGHGGSQVAEWAEKNIMGIFQIYYRNGALADTVTSAKRALLSIVKEMQESIRAIPAFYRVGATMALTMMFPLTNHVYTAILGDAEVALCRDGAIRERTVVTSPDEKEISSRDPSCWISSNVFQMYGRNNKPVNIKVQRLKGVLAVNSALGDVYMWPCLNTVPEFYAWQAQVNDRIVVACDGVWDWVNKFQEPQDELVQLLASEPIAGAATRTTDNYQIQQLVGDNQTLVIAQII